MGSGNEQWILGFSRNCVGRNGGAAGRRSLARASSAAAGEPTKSVAFVIPAGTGGGADQMARLIQSIVVKHNLMKQSLIPVNKSAGAGAEGFLEVKNSKGEAHKIVITLSNLFTTPLVARLALQFGPPEFFSVYFLTFCSFIGLGRGAPFKTLAAMMLGFALAAVGMDTMTGQLRLNFGWSELMRGFDFLIAVIGLFGIGEILLSMEEGLSFKGKSAKINLKIVVETWAKLPRYWLTSLRSCLIGCWMGITPRGATPASFMSYGVAKRMSPDGHKFGTGQLEGVIAPETAAHAAGTSALLPMLSLGIPGSPTAAVLLGGLLIWGLQPGPLLFVEQKDFVCGVDCQHVPRQSGRAHHGAYRRSAVRRHTARAVFHHSAADRGDMRDRRLYRAQRHARHLVHAAVWRHRLCVQKTGLSARAHGAGAGAR